MKLALAAALALLGLAGCGDSRMAGTRDRYAPEGYSPEQARRDAPAPSSNNDAQP